MPTGLLGALKKTKSQGHRKLVRDHSNKSEAHKIIPHIGESKDRTNTIARQGNRGNDVAQDLQAVSPIYARRFIQIHGNCHHILAHEEYKEGAAGKGG